MDTDLEALLDKARELLVQKKRVQGSKQCQGTTMDGWAGVKVKRNGPGPVPNGLEERVVGPKRQCLPGPLSRWWHTKKYYATVPKGDSRAPKGMKARGCGSEATPRSGDWSDSMEQDSGEECEAGPGATTVAPAGIHRGQATIQEGETLAQRNGLGAQSKGRHAGTITNFGTQVGMVNTIQHNVTIGVGLDLTAQDKKEEKRGRHRLRVQISIENWFKAFRTLASVCV
ncbi:hypothetical protein NDU88_003769 [Pleurodeles waltl]|uniref:Uncharacterized protein n=1 Tax=Pleurodeles waltl TaxID=8319 RepID=A0AAV7LI05_PLEWA|nr:hypothetical protein NDU88_003769 [Pleurodeles waltl]